MHLRTGHLVSIGLCAIVCSFDAGAATSGPTSADGADLLTRIEYLPPLVYYRERVSLLLRVENTAETEKACTVTVELSPSLSEKDDRFARSLTVEPGDNSTAAFQLPSAGWSLATVRLVERDVARTVLLVRRYDEDDAIPRLRASGDRLHLDGDSDAVVLVLHQRTSEPDREWYLWKRFADQLAEGAVPAGVLLFGARMAGNDEEPPYVRRVRESAGTWVDATVLDGARSEASLYPILADLVRVLNALQDARRAELVVWVVSCDDVRRATPIRMFRKGADLLLRRSRLHGASRLVVAFVPEPAVGGERRSLYAEELRAAARAYRARFMRADPLASEDAWLAPESIDELTLQRYPNRSGHTALAEELLEMIRR